jgi:hypothetical protein
MPVRYIDIMEATAPQLRAFATIVLGMENIPPKAERSEVLALLAPTYRGKTISLFEEAETLEGGKQRRTEKIVNGRTFVLLTLHRQEKAGGKEPLFVAVNGRGMFIPRGVPSWVPEEYVEVLDHAQEQVYDEYDAEKNMMGGLTTPSVHHAYPFSLN